VVRIAKQGYGNALMGGISAAQGRFVIMADADDSYNFSELGPLVESLRSGNMPGNRQSLSRRHQRRRDAVSAPILWQSAAQPDG